MSTGPQPTNPGQSQPDEWLAVGTPRFVSGPALAALLPQDFLPALSLKERLGELRDRVEARLASLDSESPGSFNLRFSTEVLMRNLEINQRFLFPPELRIVRTDDEADFGTLAKSVADLHKVTPEMHDAFMRLNIKVEVVSFKLTEPGERIFEQAKIQFGRNPGFLTTEELSLVAHPEKWGNSQMATGLRHPERYESIGETGLVWGPDGKPYNNLSTRKGEPFLVPRTTNKYLDLCLKGCLGHSGPPTASELKDPRVEMLNEAKNWVKQRALGWDQAESGFLSWLHAKFTRRRS